MQVLDKSLFDNYLRMLLVENDFQVIYQDNILISNALCDNLQWQEELKRNNSIY